MREGAGQVDLSMPAMSVIMDPEVAGTDNCAQIRKAPDFWRVGAHPAF